MAVASLVLGIISLLLSWIPVIGIVVVIPCILSIIFAIISISRNSTNKAMSITGIITSVIALGVILFMTFLSWIFVSAIDSIGDNIDLNFDNNSFHYEYHSDEEVSTEYSIKEDIKFIDRVIRVDKIEKSQGNENYKPTDGNEFHLVTVSIKNISRHDISYDCDNFYLIDNSDKEYETDYTKIKSNTTFTKGTIKSGEVVTGILCFEVPKNSKELILRFENLIGSIDISLD